MEPELRDAFAALAQAMHRPAAQIVRELIRAYIARQSMPNAETIPAVEVVELGDVTNHANKDELYRHLGI